MELLIEHGLHIRIIGSVSVEPSTQNKYHFHGLRMENHVI